MDPCDQARLLRLEHGGQNYANRRGQNFGNNALSGYGGGGGGGGGGVIVTPSAPQRTDWLNRSNATDNGAVTLPAGYPCQPGTNTNFGTTRQGPKFPATLESKFPTENPRILESALSSSFLEHTRREGATANTCVACNASFQTNSGLEGHAKDTRHSAFLCACDTSFGRLSSLARHINSNTGSGYHCELCEDRALPRIDKLYDHLRDGHKVSQKVLDRYRKTSRPFKPASAPAPAANTTQVAPPNGFAQPWYPAGQVNGMTGRHTLIMAPSSPNGIDPAHLSNLTNPFPF